MTYLHYIYWKASSKPSNVDIVPMFSYILQTLSKRCPMVLWEELNTPYIVMKRQCMSDVCRIPHVLLVVSSTSNAFGSRS
jgi:hypothetical protein